MNEQSKQPKTKKPQILEKWIEWTHNLFSSRITLEVTNENLVNVKEERERLFEILRNGEQIYNAITAEEKLIKSSDKLKFTHKNYLTPSDGEGFEHGSHDLAELHKNEKGDFAKMDLIISSDKHPRRFMTWENNIEVILKLIALPALHSLYNKEHLSMIINKRRLGYALKGNPGNPFLQRVKELSLAISEECETFLTLQKTSGVFESLPSPELEVSQEVVDKIEKIIESLDRTRIACNGGYPSEYVFDGGRIIRAYVEDNSRPNLSITPIDQWIAENEWTLDMDNKEKDDGEGKEA